MSLNRKLKRKMKRIKTSLKPLKEVVMEIQKGMDELDLCMYKKRFEETIDQEPIFKRIKFSDNLVHEYPEVVFPFFGQGFIGITEDNKSVYHLPYLIDGITAMRQFNRELEIEKDIFKIRYTSWDIFIESYPLESYHDKSVLVWDTPTQVDRIVKIGNEHGNFVKNNF
jgi:hypothetical protein